METGPYRAPIELQGTESPGRGARKCEDCPTKSEVEKKDP
jgi:hypothetical protein